jgi:multiple sugar transport system ATP-binding protein
MDEPLSNLDAKLRVSTRTQIASLQRRLDITTVYVTHDQVEAMTMGDRVAVLKDGLLQQVDTPLNLYSRPVNLFVAGFIGSPAMNIGTFQVEDGKATLGKAHVPLTRATTGVAGNEVILGFRPEALRAVPEATPGAFPVQVLLVEELGSDAYLYGELVDETSARMTSEQIVARIDPTDVPAKGSTVWLQIREGKQHVFDATSGERLPD